MVTGSVTAHVQLDHPLGGESFVTGKIVNIQWSLTIAHSQENWDLYFSPDGGNNWEEIKLDMNISRFKYHWTVPQIVTENARIRIVQDNAGTDYDDTSADFIITETQTSIEIQEKNPKSFTLRQNYPNPFNPTTTINYELVISSNIELMIFDQLGQEVRSLVNGRQHANYYQIQWDGRDNSGKQVMSGIYVYRLKVDSFSQARKMMLLR
jgi:hypothetical protein